MCEVLSKLVEDAMAVYNEGGIVTAHQIEFDAGIIYKELGRCRLYNLQEKWDTIVRNGFCTMSPSFGKWLLQDNGAHMGPQSIHYALGLKPTARLILPQQYDFKHHDAEHDAKLCRMIFVESAEKIRASTKSQP